MTVDTVGAAFFLSETSAVAKRVFEVFVCLKTPSCLSIANEFICKNVSVMEQVIWMSSTYSFQACAKVGALAPLEAD